MSDAPTPPEFSRNLVAGLFVASGLMVPVALWLRPLHLQWWDPAHFPTVAGAMDAWIWSVRVLVFGLFLRVGAWAALGAFPWREEHRSIVSAGVMISVLGLCVSALGHGYYMDTGVWGSWAVTQPEYQGTDGVRLLLAGLRPVNAWGECLLRMGSVFYSLGAVFLSVAFIRASFLPRWAAVLPLLYGLAGMGFGMFLPNEMGPNLGIAGVQSAWCLLAGVLLLRPARD